MGPEVVVAEEEGGCTVKSVGARLVATLRADALVDDKRGASAAVALVAEESVHSVIRGAAGACCAAEPLVTELATVMQLEAYALS